MAFFFGPLLPACVRKNTRDLDWEDARSHTAHSLSQAHFNKTGTKPNSALAAESNLPTYLTIYTPSGHIFVIYRAWYNERSNCVTPSEREFRKETHEAYVVIGKQSQQRREVGVVILFHLPYLYIDPSLRSRRDIFQKV